MSSKDKSANQPRAYLFAGDDDYRKQQELEKLLGDLVAPDFADFDFEQMEGDSATSDRIMAGLAIPPFSSTKRVVLVKFANKMDEAEQKKLARQLPDTPSSACLILVTPASDKTGGRIKKGDEVIGDISRAIRKVGSVVKVGGEKGRARTDSARKHAASIFAAAGKKIDEKTLTAFIQRVGADFSVLTSEAQKLIDYSGDGSAIKAADVARVVCETPEEKVFKLVDAIGARKPREAMRFLDELFETGDRPESEAPKVLANIARTFRLIWQYKMLSKAGVRYFQKGSVPQELLSFLPSTPNLLDILSRQSWQENRLRSQASLMSRDHLINGFDAIARADSMLKGADGGAHVEDPRMIMELLVLELSQ
ncbi:MAG: DNA polymerase III subunit delta [Armatimonadetes bacterium]|nr:DNA polymerase III subunit delta [Armatimonadota bacterium]